MSITILLALAGCGDSFDGAVDVDDSLNVGPAVQPLDLSAARPYATDRVIIGFRDAPAERVRLFGDEAPRVKQFASSRSGVYQVPVGVDVMDAIAELRASGDFDYVEPDYVREIASVDVDDPYVGYQWHMDMVGARDAWDWTMGEGVVVAVLDTGVSDGPLDGIGQLLQGWDFVNGDDDPSDDHGHGTHVAGTIAQATDNGQGVVGLAPGASILPVKVMSASGIGYTSDIVAGIEYAIDQGAQVINMSIGSASGSSAEEAAVQAAWDAGVFVAAATGNESAHEINFPAGYAGAVAVGATGGADTVSGYSNTGDGISLVAPGGDLSADADGDGYPDGVLQETFAGPTWSYFFYEGTSMAAPHVAGAAALLMSAGATHEEALSLLIESAVDVGDPGYDLEAGHGRIDAAAALELLHAQVDDPGDAGLQITDVQAERDGPRNWWITWDTDVPSTTQVCMTFRDRCTAERDAMVTEHRARVTARPGGEYVVISVDDQGQVTMSDIHTLD